MIKKILKHKTFPLILLFIIISNIVFLPELSAESIEDKLDKIKSEKESTQKKIEDIKKEESEYIKEVNNIEQDLLSSLDELNDLNTRLAAKKNKMDEIAIDLAIRDEQIQKIEKDLNKKIEIFNNRIKIIYMNQDRNILEVLFKSGDFIEFVSRLKLYNLLAKQDAQTVLEIKQKRKLLNESKKEVLELRESEAIKKKELEELLEQAELKKRGVEDIYNKKKELLTITQANKDALILMENQLYIKELEVTKMLQSYN